jgi:cell division cycle 2-like protein
LTLPASASTEGTFGVVFRAREKRTGKVYALKKLKLEREKDGFPQTSIREVNVLLSLHHPNIVNVTEVSAASLSAGTLSDNVFRGLLELD